MNHQISRMTAVQNLKDLAREELELLYQRDFQPADRRKILAAVASWTPGINPIVRDQQWSSFVSAFEAVQDLQNGFYDTEAVLSYIDGNGRDPLCPTDRVAVHNAAVDDMAEAIDRLFTPRRLQLVAS